MNDNRRICANCEEWRRFKGVMECQNRDSDYMYKPTLPDDGCDEFEPADEFERKEEREDDR